MTSFTNIYKQELKSKGILSSLGSTALKRIRERLDPRNMLFGGSGMIAATGQKIFGKGYSAVQSSPGSKLSTKTAEVSGLQTEAVTSLLASSLKQESQLAIIAKNTMNNNMMARDMNVMRQNIMKLVTMGGGKASRGADMFFKDAKARESEYESKFKKDIPTTAPTPVKQEKEKSGGILGMLATLVGPLLGVGKLIVSTITSALSGLGEIVLKGLRSIFSVDTLLKALGLTTNVLTAIFKVAAKVATNPLFLALAGIASAAEILAFMRSDYDARKDEYLNLAKKKKESGTLSGEEEARLKELDVPALREAATKELQYDPIEGKASAPKTAGQIAAQNRRDTLKGAVSPAEHKERMNNESYAARIGLSESGGRYDTIFGKAGGAMINGKLVTENTIAEVVAWQQSEKAKKSNKQAAGKYQFMDVAGAAKAAGLQSDDLFNGPNQEKMMQAYTAANAKSLERLGLPSTTEYLSMAHAVGAAGAKKLIDAQKAGQGSKNSLEILGLKGASAQTNPQLNTSVDNTVAKLKGIGSSTGTALAAASTASSDLNRTASTQQPPAVIVNAPQTTNVAGAQSAAPQAASATNIDALDLFFKFTM